MWKSNPPRYDNRGYTPRHLQNAQRPVPMKQMMHHQPRGGKLFSSVDNEYNGDVDGRNFDEVYAQQPQMNASYGYGRNVPTSHTPMYHQNYQNTYQTAAPNGYAYANSPTASVPSSQDASYPAAPSQGYGQYDGQYASNAMQGNGYYDPYGQQYSNQYGNNFVPPQMMMGQSGYANYSSYYDEGGSPVPSQGVIASGDGGLDPYSYSGDVDYDHDATADKYE